MNEVWAAPRHGPELLVQGRLVPIEIRLAGRPAVRRHPPARLPLPVLPYEIKKQATKEDYIVYGFGFGGGLVEL